MIRSAIYFTLSISIHALRVEGDSYRMRHLSAWSYISIHALRVEGDQLLLCLFHAVRQFLSTPSGWRATARLYRGILISRISIHALRVEGDQYMRQVAETHRRISIHALRVEGDIGASKLSRTTAGFLSTPSGWRATFGAAQGAYSSQYFYPRPPGGGRRISSECRPFGGAISIHALRVEGDIPQHGGGDRWRYFYPRPPGGGRR